jgi:hypothetical protein
MMFMYGTAATARWQIGLIYLLEFFPYKQKKIVGTAAHIAGSLPLLFGTAIAFFIGDTMWIQIMLLTINGATVLSICLYLPESPKFLYSNGRFSECRQVLARMALTNDCNSQG